MKPHWKPKVGQTYWFVDISAKHVDSFQFKPKCYNGGSKVKDTAKSMDMMLWETGNCFQTQAQAKAAAKIIRGVFKQIQEDSENFPEFSK